MRALVTGSTGFLGSHLVRELLARGANVTALVREVAVGHRPGEIRAALEAKGVNVVHGDVLHPETVVRAATGCDIVFHCAGKVSRKREDAGKLHKVHVEGTKIALDAAKKAGIRKVIVASTSGVVAVSDKCDDVRGESAPTPIEIVSKFPYYVSKLYAEHAALERNVDGFEVVVVSPTLLLGPGDLLGSSTSDVVDLLEERVPFVPAGGISFVDARDAAIGMILAAEKGKAGSRYLMHAQNLTLRAFADKVTRIAGVHAPMIQVPRSPLLARMGGEAIEKLRKKVPSLPGLDPITAEMAQYFWYVDSTKARTDLGWTPRDPVDTLVDTIDDLKSRGIAWPRASA